MKKILIGNDIRFRWILKNTQQQVMELNHLVLKIVHKETGKIFIPEFTVKDNEISIHYPAEKQKELGIYHLDLSFKDGNSIRVVSRETFCLSDVYEIDTCQCTEENSCVDIDIVNVVSELNYVNGRDGKDGKSAYEIAVEHGFTGTEEEWLESLQGNQDYLNKLELGGRNLVSPKLSIKNKLFGYINPTNGKIDASVGDIYTDFILVKDYKKLTVKVWENPSIGSANIVFYDSSQNFISGISLPSSQYSSKVVDIPNNAFYIRISIPDPEKVGGLYKFEFGEKWTDYTESPEDFFVSIDTKDMSSYIKNNVDSPDDVDLQTVVIKSDEFTLTSYNDNNFENYYSINAAWRSIDIDTFGMDGMTASFNISPDELIMSAENGSRPTGSVSLEMGSGEINFYTKVDRKLFYNNKEIATKEEDSGWINAELLNGGKSYTNTGSTFNPPQYRKIGDKVILRGMFEYPSTNPNTFDIFQLPEDFRPQNTEICGSLRQGNSPVSRIEITPEGKVTVVAGSSTWTTLNGIEFYID